MERFYRQLGFRVSDRTARGMTFLRCNQDHHTLALTQSTGTGVQHVAYDVVDLDSVMRALGWFTSNDLACIWGPGRHGPGNNIFTYYTDPAGLIVEYYAELQQIGHPEDDIEERYWGPEWSGDLWGLAGPPPPEFRR
jgi:catechol-2,3-dioxygenase